MDIVSHDGRKFFRLLLKKNGYVLEQLFSPLIVHTTPENEELKAIAINGAGKSTSLQMLTGLFEPSAGTATICGFDLQREPLEVKKRVGFVPESGAVFESQSRMGVRQRSEKKAQGSDFS